MINKSIPLSFDVKAAPFLLKPCGKSYLWGGTRLNDEFGKEIDKTPLAETWECSTHPEGLSIVASGMMQGKTLKEVLKEHPEYLGIHSEHYKDLPILIKFIDAKENLSIQVHPDDNYAKKYEDGQLGKSEMWYVLDAETDTYLLYGLKQDIDKNILYKSVQDGEVEQFMQKIKISKNDVFYIEAGIIHAIGAGALIVEIQENSDLTYRIYDYNRIDKNGIKRKLHIEKALAVANLKSSTEPVQPMRVLKYRPGCASELLCRCKYFEVFRIIINTECCKKMIKYEVDNISFHVLLCIAGCGTILMEDGEFIVFFKGDCIFFPANSIKVKIHGKMELLDVKG